MRLKWLAGCHWGRAYEKNSASRFASSAEIGGGFGADGAGGVVAVGVGADAGGVFAVFVAVADVAAAAAGVVGAAVAMFAANAHASASASAVSVKENGRCDVMAVKVVRVGGFAVAGCLR